MQTVLEVHAIRWISILEDQQVSTYDCKNLMWQNQGLLKRWPPSSPWFFEKELSRIESNIIFHLLFTSTVASAYKVFFFWDWLKDSVFFIYLYLRIHFCSDILFWTPRHFLFCFCIVENYLTKSTFTFFCPSDIWHISGVWHISLLFHVPSSRCLIRLLLQLGYSGHARFSIDLLISCFHSWGQH